jgi:hypothetical protein
MSKHARLVIAIFSFFALYVIYVLMSKSGIGSFEEIRSAGEINQSVNVLVDRSKGFERDQNGHIVSFYVQDKEGEVATVSPNEPVTADIASAEVVELFGHMHGNNFVALRVSIAELAKE